MKKILAVVSTIILLGLILFLALPSLFSSLIKDKFKQEVTTLQKYYPENHIQAKLVKNTWFKSQIQFSFVQRKSKVSGVLNLSNGPIVISRDGLTFGLAKITSSKVHSSAYGNATYRGVIGYSGNIHMKGKVKSFQKAISKLEKPYGKGPRVTVGGGMITLNTSAGFNELTLNSTMHDFKIVTPKIAQDSRIVVRIPEMTQLYHFTNFNSPNYRLESSSIARKVSVSQKGFFIQMKRMEFNNFKMDRKSVKEMESFVQDAKHIKKIQAEFKNKKMTAQQKTEFQKHQKAFLKKMIGIFKQTVGNNTSVNISGGKFKLPQGKGSFGLHAKFYGIDAKHPLNKKTISQHLRYHFFIKMPKFVAKAKSKKDIGLEVDNFNFDMKPRLVELSIGKVNVTQGSLVLGNAYSIDVQTGASKDNTDTNIFYNIKEKSICVMGQCFTDGNFNVSLNHVNYQALLDQDLTKFKLSMLNGLLHKMVNHKTTLSSSLNVHAPLGEVSYNFVGTFPKLTPKTSLQDALSIKASFAIPEKYIDMFIGPVNNQQQVTQYSVSMSPVLPQRLAVMRQVWMQEGYLTKKDGHYHLGVKMKPGFEFSANGKPISQLEKAAALINMGLYPQAEKILMQPQYAKNPNAQRMVQAIIAAHQAQGSEAKSNSQMITPQPIIYRK